MMIFKGGNVAINSTSDDGAKRLLYFELGMAVDEYPALATAARLAAGKQVPSRQTSLRTRR